MNARSTISKCPNILGWLPSRWDEFLGNTQIKTLFQKLVVRLRTGVSENRWDSSQHLCFLLTGQSRSGKTAIAKFLVRCIRCKSFDENTLNPCDGSCSECVNPFEDDYGIFVYSKTPMNKMPLHTHFVDCTKIYTPSELKNTLRNMRDKSANDGYLIAYFDEIHRLVNRQMDEILLKEVEEQKFLWIFSTAKPENLEDMFQNRMLKLKTELPSKTEMANWIVDRCNEWEIKWHEEAVVRLVGKSNRVVGTALHALALASIDPEEGLTFDLVERLWNVSIEN